MLTMKIDRRELERITTQISSGAVYAVPGELWPDRDAEPFKIGGRIDPPAGGWDRESLLLLAGAALAMATHVDLAEAFLRHEAGRSRLHPEHEEHRSACAEDERRAAADHVALLARLLLCQHDDLPFHAFRCRGDGDGHAEVTLVLNTGMDS